MKALKIMILFVVVTITSNISAQTIQTKVFVTKQGKSYHKKECRLLPKTHIKTTIKRAKVKGYVPCKVCIPKEKAKTSKANNSKKQRNKAVSKKKQPTKRSTVVRCSATTQKGTQCKRRTKNSSGKCWQHH